ncbi:MAG: beta-propeller fold lactonase family protein [Alphaproteobacteria bacterium]|nr:beta-propeller fold lactonase family protein [Alphaproteobacteria bacterium]
MLRKFLVLAVFLLPFSAAAFDLEFVAASPEIYAEPHDLVLSPDGRYLYVADNGNDRIAVLDPKTLELLGTFGEGEVGAPHDAAFDARGRLLVADTDNSRITIYAVNGPKGKLVGELTGSISRPEGVAVHPNGRVYATGASSGNIEAFENGKPVAEADGLSSPHDVAVASDGTIWIADASNDRLVQMTEDLKVLRTVGGDAFDFNGPRYLDFDNQGRLYVADKYTHQIKVLAPDTSLILTLGGSGKGPGKFDRPEGVAIDGKNVWFSDTYNDRIVRYRIIE